MGTNFYLRGHRFSSDPVYHIGKRSAAGPYCWDCKMTLCKEGESRVHYSESQWYAECPQCGKYPNENPSQSSVARELGFNKTIPKTKEGVASCCSFSWAMDPVRFQRLCANPPKLFCSECERGYPKDEEDIWIMDEYGTLYTTDEFLHVLKECPIRYTDSIGKSFS